VYRFHLTPEDLAQVRFAVDPLWECVASVRVLDHAGRHALHFPWVRETADAVRGLDLAPLRALLGGSCPPHVLAPPPDGPSATFAEQLARLRATPAVASLAGLVEAYWERALAPHWPRFEAVLEGDILWRARLLALDGAAGLLRDLHPQVCWRDDATVRVHAGPVEREVCPAGRGLLLVPSIFAWPDVSVATDPAVRPSLRYAARGVAELWLQECAPPSLDAAGALGELIGQTRASLLLRMLAPMTTGEVARRAGLTAGAASQHLTALAGAGMLQRTRVGRRVYYQRSARAERVLAALREEA
jgi:DNA-binding transcriptional ArsR family regulator